jgi:hypothetical protein
MQSLAWSTVVIVVLLLPGFFYYGGLYMPERFARDVTPRNPLGALATTVLIAFLTHVTLSAVASVIAPVTGYRVDWEAVLDAIQLSPPRPNDFDTSVHRAAIAFSQNSGRILLYVLCSCITGGMAGLAIGWAVVSGWLRAVVKHSWTYAFKPGSTGKLPYAHVLTTVAHEDKVLQYRGRFLYFNLNADGTFAYVVLAPMEHCFLRLDGKTAFTDGSAQGGAPVAERRVDVVQGGAPRPGRRRMQWPQLFGRRKTDVNLLASPLAAGADAQLTPAAQVPKHSRKFRVTGVITWIVRGSRTLPDRVKTTGKALPGWSKQTLRTVAGIIAAPFVLIAEAVRRAIKPDATGSVLVIPGSIVRSVVIDRVYEVQNLPAESTPSSEAAEVVEDPSLPPGEKLVRLEKLRHRWAAEGAPVLTEPVAPEVSDDSSPQEMIATLQRMLHDLGYDPGPTDGDLGPSTRAAVHRFQRDQELVTDGRPGPATWKRLNREHAAFLRAHRLPANITAE